MAAAIMVEDFMAKGLERGVGGWLELVSECESVRERVWKSGAILFKNGQAESYA